MSWKCRHRHFPWGISHLFLIINVIVRTARLVADCFHPITHQTRPQTMLIGSGAVITRKHTEYAVGGLLAVVVIQAFGYGLIFDLNFFLRNLSVIGGLLMVFTDAMYTRKKLFAGLPTLSENDRKK